MICFKMTAFSGGMASPLTIPMITKVSPEGTAFTIPFSHLSAAAAIAKLLGSTNNKFPITFSLKHQNWIEKHLKTQINIQIIRSNFQIHHAEIEHSNSSCKIKVNQIKLKLTKRGQNLSCTIRMILIYNWIINRIPEINLFFQKEKKNELSKHSKLQSLRSIKLTLNSIKIKKSYTNHKFQQSK